MLPVPVLTFCQLIGQPVQALVQTGTLRGAGALGVPLRNKTDTHADVTNDTPPITIKCVTSDHTHSGVKRNETKV